VSENGREHGFMEKIHPVFEFLAKNERQKTKNVLLTTKKPSSGRNFKLAYLNNRSRFFRNFFCFPDEICFSTTYL